MACTGIGPYTWYLYDENWVLIDCVDNSLTSYSFTGITSPGIYNVKVVHDGSEVTTQFTITGNEACCWDSTVYQPCDESCSQLAVNSNLGAIDVFFKKLNNTLGFNSTYNISSTPLDVSVLYSTDFNGTDIYFENLLRSYECCSVEPGAEILFTAPCINDPIYKVIKFCNTCDDDLNITGYTFSNDCNNIICPSGYVLDPDQQSCTKTTYTAVTVPDEFYPVAATATDASYGDYGANFYVDLTPYTLPVKNDPPPAAPLTPLIDSLSITIPIITNVESTFWGSGSTTSGRLNNGVGIWTDDIFQKYPIGVWIGFTYCLNVPATRPYYLGIGGDNYVRIDINGETIVQADGPGNADVNFRWWHVFSVNLNSGINVIQLFGQNQNGPASFGAEIYSATTLAELTAATNTTEAGVIWNTNEMIGSYFDLAETSGYTCPSGFVYGNCNGTPICVEIDKVASSATTLCEDNWDVRFLYYDGDCETRELSEFDPWSTTLSFSGGCDGFYPYDECKCFYVAIGYRGDDINDHYTNLNLFLTDSTPTGVKTISYLLHGRASLRYPATTTLNSIIGGASGCNLLTDPIESCCPDKPGCDCLTVTSNDNTDDNDGYPISVGGVPYYQFDKTYTIKNTCYTDFQIAYSGMSPSYSGLTIDYSDFDGTLHKNETATLTLTYSSLLDTDLNGLIWYSASTIDPFLCDQIPITCPGFLTFDFTALPVPLSISNYNYNFGNIGDGCCGLSTFTIQNTGTEIITILDVSLTNSFFNITSPTLPFTTQQILYAGGTLPLTIQFCPTGCTDGMVYSSDLSITTLEYGIILGSSLGNSFSISGSDVCPPISASTDSLVFIKHTDESIVSALTICNRTSVDQTVDMSNCIQFVSGGTSEIVDPLDFGFEIIIENDLTIQNSITYPRELTIAANSCETVDIRYDINQPDKTFCSVYLRDDCGNITEIPFTGYSLPYPIGLTTTTHTDPVCYGNSNGTISISFSGGAAPYNYIFSGDGIYQTGTLYGDSVLFSNLSAVETGTNYIFSLSGNPCDGSMNIPDLSPFILPTSPEVILMPSLITTLTQPTYFEITSTNYTGLTCVQSAAASVTVSGGTIPYIFNWSTGDIQTGNTTPYTTTLDGLTTGTYGINVVDFNGCQRYTNINIPSLLPITVFPQITSVSCYGGTDGTANLIVGNAFGPVVYIWSGETYDGYDVYPSHTDAYTSTTSNNLTAGTYVVVHTDYNGCSGITLFNILQPTVLGFYATPTDITCPYLTNGTVTFNPLTGGTLPYTIYASGDTAVYSSGTSNILTNVDAGYYNTYVVDGNGCETPYQNLTITKPDPFAVVFDYTATTCTYSTDGQILLNVSGGTPPYSYLWTPSIGSSNYVTGLSYGHYNVLIFDDNGCSLSTGFTLPYTTSYCGDLNITDINDVPITQVGGVYMVNMMHTCLNTTSEKFIKLCQTSPCTFNILSYSGISTTVDDFYLGLDITGTIIPSSGCTTISVIFNPTSAQTYNDIFSLTTEYCTHYFSLSGTGVENTISADTQYVDFGNICFGTADTKYITVLNLTPDDRTLSIQTVPSEFTSTSNLILSANTSVAIPYTFTPTYPLSYPVIWQREFTGTTKLTNCPTLEIGLSGTGYGGNLYVSALDFGCVNHNCYLDQTATIYNYHCLPVGITSIDIPSYYSNYLYVLGFTPTTIAPGGTTTFTVRYSAMTSISSFVTVNTDFSLASVLMSGITACMVNTLSDVESLMPMLTVPGTPITQTVDIINVSVTNLFIGTNITNLTGGTPTNVTVAPPLVALPAPVSPSTATTATLTISFNDFVPVNEWFYLNLTDNCGNHNSLPFYISSTAIGYTDLSINYPSCYGFTNGSISFTPTGGTPPYTTVWDIGVTGNSVSNLSADTYWATINDFFGNLDVFSFTLPEPNELGISHTVPFNGSYNIFVYSANTGYIDITVTGGTLPYSYFWNGTTYQGISFTSIQEDITGLTAGNYNVTVTDVNGCQITDSASLTQPGPITIVINNCTPPVPPAPYCTLTGGTADITVSGGQCPYSIVVCPTVPQNPLFDAGGPYYGFTTCQILPDCGVVPSGITCVSSTCYCCDDSLSPCLSGSCPCIYCNVIINNLPPGIYPPGSIGVIDINSGSTVYVVPVFVPDPSTLGFTLSQSPATCGGQSNGSITATVVPTMNQLGQYGMGVPPYTYFLNGTQQGLPTTATTQTFTDLTPNYYTVTIQDDDLNSVTHSIVVTQGTISAGLTVIAETLQESNGSITIDHIFGGIGPYTATINSGAPVIITDGYIFNGLPAGSYLIKITDSLGCIFTVKPTITRTIPMTAGQSLTKTKSPVINPTIYEKRLGGFKLIPKKK